MARTARSTRSSAKADAVHKAEGVLEGISTKDWNNKVMTNIKVDGDWYGLGSGKIPEDILEGDIIAFDYTVNSKNGKEYKNAVAKTLELIEEGPGEDAKPAVKTGGSSYNKSDDTHKSILRQVAYKVAGQGIVAAIVGDKLKIGAKNQYDVIMDHIHNAADDIYLRLVNSDGYPTLESQIVDSIDDDDDDDLGDFDDN